MDALHHLPQNEGRTIVGRSALTHSSHRRKAAGRDRMWQRPLAVLRRRPVRSERDDDVSTDAERVVKVKVAARRLLRDAVDLHALHVRRRPSRDRRAHRVRVVPDHFHRRARVQVSVVHGVLGYHRREHEDLARPWHCLFVCLFVCPNEDDGPSAFTVL